MLMKPVSSSVTPSLGSDVPSTSITPSSGSSLHSTSVTPSPGRSVSFFSVTPSSMTVWLVLNSAKYLVQYVPTPKRTSKALPRVSGFCVLTSSQSLSVLKEKAEQRAEAELKSKLKQPMKKRKGRGIS